jgi:hypothetical protein
MTQALITVNTIAGSNTDLPINTIVQLNNTGNGGESTYLWSILDQPPGTTDALSSTTIVNPTFTPKKEGSYLVQLIVNNGLADQQVNRVVCAVKQLKTRTRVPAAGETTEADANDGYAADANASLRLLDTMRADPGIVVVQLGYSAAAQDVLAITGVAVIKSGLPGQETVPLVTKALATSASVLSDPLLLLLAAVDGGALTSGKLAYARAFGLVTPASSAALVGAADEAAVYVADTGVLDDTVGTNSRKLGKVVDTAGGTISVFFNGLGK